MSRPGPEYERYKELRKGKSATNSSPRVESEGQVMVLTEFRNEKKKLMSFRFTSLYISSFLSDSNMKLTSFHANHATG
jgi:hypothetical protein